MKLHPKLPEYPVVMAMKGVGTSLGPPPIACICSRKTDGVIWMDNGTAEFSSHKKLLKDNSAYRELYQLQTDYSVAKPTESAIERGIC